MARSAFDMDFSGASQQQPIRPLFTLRKLDDPSEMLAWQNSTYSVETSRIAKYREQCQRHVELYAGNFYNQDGVQGRSQFAEASQNALGVPGSRVSKIVINHLQALCNQKVSRLTRNKVDIGVEPANSEFSDRVSAKVVKYWLDYQTYQLRLDRLLTTYVRDALVMGESYLHPFFDPNRGDYTPAWREERVSAKKAQRPPRIGITDDDGNPVMGEDGEQLFAEKPVKVGDVNVLNLNPLNTLVESCGSFDAADYFFYDDFLPVDTIKALYPEVAEKVQADDEDEDHENVRTRATMGATNAPGPGKALVRYFYHRPTDLLASGRFVMSTRHAVLENKPMPVGATGLPLVRFTDIDTPTQQRGVSFFTLGKSLNASQNDLASMARKNAIMMSHPRWLIPRGSLVKKDSLNNDISSIEYAGPLAPRIEAPPQMSAEINVLRSNLREEMYSVLGISDVEMGKTPPNIRSALAFQAVDEQADQRANTAIGKYNSALETLAEKMINLASCYYEKADERLVPIVGRDNQYLLKAFDPTHLSKAFDVRVTAGGGMPSTKSAKTEVLLELRKLDPEGKLVPNNKFMEMLEFSKADEFYDTATAEVQAAMIGHVQATEYLMLQTARKNPAYSINLAKLEQFPAFFNLAPADRVLLDRARTGNPLTLVEIDMLYSAGVMPTPGMGAAPPPGGAQGEVNRNDPMYEEKTPPGGQPVPGMGAPEAPPAEGNAEPAAPAV